MKKHFTLFVMALLVINSTFSQDQLKQLFDVEANYEHFSGNALVIGKDQSDFKFSSGYANRETAEKITFEHSFDIGSLSKQFTAAGILHLAYDEKLSLNEPINTYLKELASKKWDDVTIHHLLSHTSGIPSLFQSGQGLDDILPDSTAVEIDELIYMFKDHKLRFKPGSEYSYSNSGYILLAKIIENISNKSFQEYLREHVFEKYGLLNTNFGQPIGLCAKPYTGYRSDLVEDRVDYHWSWTIGAGGVYSTMKDLQNWISIIQSDQFLTAELKELYLGKHIKKRGGYYGYGWEIATNDTGDIYQHDGVMFGYVTYLGFKPSTNELVILQSNQTHDSFTLIGQSYNYIIELKDKVWAHLNNESIEILPEKKTQEIAEGSYCFPDGYQISIKDCGTHYQVSGIGNYSPSRLLFNQPFDDQSEKGEKLSAIARNVPLKKYWKIAWAFDGEMKFVIYSGLFRLGFGQVTSGLGEIKSSKPFYIGETSGKFRLYGENEILDMIIYFDEQGQVQGIFENGYYQFFNKMTLKAFPISENTLYLDGFPYGEMSAKIKIENDRLKFSQLGREFTATKISQ
ncbi:MAG: beta-lactamase family protein [bacterium]|nr:beta-lactamase family protein [bacterium]